MYAVLGEQWGTKAFTNIAAAEQTHTDAVKALLDRYEIADPSADKGADRSPILRSRSSTRHWSSRGAARSSTRSLVRGDDRTLTSPTSRPVRPTPPTSPSCTPTSRGDRATTVRAFTKQLDRNGASYTPSHITQAEYDAIVSSGIERGSGG